MRPFDYATPANVDEAIGLLEAGPAEQVRPLAGGTDLLTLMKAALAAPSLLVNVKQIDGLEAGIRETPDGLTLGALTTLAEIETSALVKERAPALAEACALAATPQLRNMATIGGNLLQRPRCWYFRNALFHCWLKGGDECQARDGENQQHAIFDQSPCVAVHPSDPAVALMALGASVTLRGPRGERTISVEELFAPPDEDRRTETTLADGELVLAGHVPLAPGTRSVYLKAMDRKIWAFALVSVAVAAKVDGGRLSRVRLALGGVANVPLRATDAEQALEGAAPTDDAALDRAAEAALAGATPLAHNGYKIPLLKSLLKRAVRQLGG